MQHSRYRVNAATDGSAGLRRSDRVGGVRSPATLTVLGIEVDRVRLGLWSERLAPDPQPFFLPEDDALGRDVGKNEALSADLRDTYCGWRIDRSLAARWVTEERFMALPRADRVRLVRSQVDCRRGAVPTVRRWADLLDPVVLRAQADGHRFVWWPSLLRHHEAEILGRLVDKDRLPSQHERIDAATWAGCAAVVPRARALGGTFPPGSGPNCFGTVMGGCGVEGAEDTWMQIEPFAAWLAASTRPATRAADGDPGTVFVWSDHGGVPAHAAVGIGAGWALKKPSQEWSSPRTIVRVADMVRANRTPDWRLQRHAMIAGRSGS